MSDTTPEQWLPIPDWEGLYEVSDLGRIRSLPRRGGNNRIYGGTLLTPFVDSVGYLAVGLWANGRQRPTRVHVAVAAAFLGRRPAGQEVRHLDGDKTNPLVTNLAYGTRSENQQDSVRHGTNVNAAKTHCKRGHEFTAENTKPGRGGRRECRRCSMLSVWERRGKLPDSPRKTPKTRTHCKRGHEFTPENTYWRSDGTGRQCRECIQLRRAMRAA